MATTSTPASNPEHIESGAASSQKGDQAMPALIVRRLGLLPYEPVWRAMQTFTDNRGEQTPDEIWLCQHPPVFTQGQAGKAEHVLMPGDIPVVQVDRGGQVTYHGPGQLMAYILIKLPRLKIGVRELVTAMESTLVESLASYGITAYPKKDAPGVYVDTSGRHPCPHDRASHDDPTQDCPTPDAPLHESKIASLGLRVRKGASFHGLALNVDMDLEPFRRINPCGYAGLTMTQMKDFVPNVEIDEVASRWLDCFQRYIGYRHYSEQRGLPA